MVASEAVLSEPLRTRTTEQASKSTMSPYYLPSDASDGIAFFYLVRFPDRNCWVKFLMSFKITNLAEAVRTMKKISILLLLVSVHFPLTTFAQEDKNKDIIILDNSEENSRLGMEWHLKRVQEEKQARLLMTFLSQLEKNNGLIDTLELVDEQKDEIRAIQEEYQKEEALLVISDDPTEADERKYDLLQQKLKDRFAKKIRDCLMDGQVEAIFSSRILDKGVPKVLVESQIGAVLRLTDDQKKRIAKSSDEISKKIGEFQREIRREACKAVFDELTSEQRKQLLKVYDIDALTSYFHKRSLLRLRYDYYFIPYEETPKLFELKSVYPEFKKGEK